MAWQELLPNGLNRRSALGAMGALAGAAGASGFAWPAFAAPAPISLYTFKGLYAIDGGRIIDGYIAAPRGKNRLNVLLLIHDANGYDALAEASAQRYARAGYCAIAPNLTTTCVAATHDARVEEMRALAPRLALFPLGNGKVMIGRV